MRESPVRSLADLCEKQAVSDVLYRYATAIDTRDWAGFRSCFTDEVEVDLSSWNGSPPTRLAAEAWVEGVRRGLAGFDSTQHISANHVIALEGGTARATSCVQASHVLEGERCVLAGHYETGLERTPRGWRIRRSRLNVTWRQGDETIFERAARRAPRPAR